MAGEQLDARAKPPEVLRPVFKRYQRAKPHDLDATEDEGFLDISKALSRQQEQRVSSDEPYDEAFLRAVFSKWTGRAWEMPIVPPKRYMHSSVPGLHIIPSMLPPEVQILLLDRLIHRDLIQPHHQTNVHLHHDVQYPDNSKSFFSIPPTSITSFPGLSPDRAPLPVSNFLNTKLRWVTLGGQYDWTAKRYPPTRPPPFPQDIADLLHALFPGTLAQAAIVNFYSPGDTLSVHRDVSESCDRGLVSVSLGCDAVFMAALEDGEGGVGHVEVRLRSGDAVYMSGRARYAWHGVPRVLEGTCPEWLRGWPGGEYPGWEGWMANKRVNLNVRQMEEGDAGGG